MNTIGIGIQILVVVLMQSMILSELRQIDDHLKEMTDLMETQTDLIEEATRDE